ncbi:hypothetical protein SCIP_0490 [Scardovia inopinata JCM 12537]|nr:hypothetical protein SCIP_0490 [Scardovia inopinata JCM 12537]
MYKSLYTDPAYSGLHCDFGVKGRREKERKEKRRKSRWVLSSREHPPAETVYFM